MFRIRARRLLSQKNLRDAKATKTNDLILRLASSDFLSELLDDARFLTHILHKWHANEINGEDSQRFSRLFVLQSVIFAAYHSAQRLRFGGSSRE